MQINTPFYLLLAVCLMLLLKQALVRDKTNVHYLFAIFCASLCMMTIKELSATSIGPYQYLIGFATCATCNVAWLISRALFRTNNAIERRHILLAVVIAFLIILNQTWHLAEATGAHQWFSEASMLKLKTGLNEVTTLLSSSILAMTFWEALRNYGIKNKALKKQSIIFASAFCIAAFNSMVLSKVLFSPEQLTFMSPWITCSSALIMVSAIQLIIHLQAKQAQQIASQQSYLQQSELQLENEKPETNDNADPAIVQGIGVLMHKQKMFLQSNLKVSDVAQALGQPEYKVSKAIRCHFKAPNFNFFVNQYRVEHAKTLLADNSAAKWNILVVGLESGFSSLATFNRAFKALAGDMPSEYRKKRG